MTYHISHTDLDGYGCQMVTKKALPSEEIVSYNTGYGKKTQLFYWITMKVESLRLKNTLGITLILLVVLRK